MCNTSLFSSTARHPRSLGVQPESDRVRVGVPPGPRSRSDCPARRRFTGFKSRELSGQGPRLRPRPLKRLGILSATKASVAGPNICRAIRRPLERLDRVRVRVTGTKSLSPYGARSQAVTPERRRQSWAGRESLVGVPRGPDHVSAYLCPARDGHDCRDRDGKRLAASVRLFVSANRLCEGSPDP